MVKRRGGWDGEIRLMRQIGIKFFMKNSKEFWASVGKTSKGNRCFLRSTSSSCITSTKGKLEVLHEHYERLGTATVDEEFDDSWREHIEKKVTEYSEMFTEGKG